MRHPTQNPSSQQGAALIVGLILLLVLTILAVATMSTANLEVVMASNKQNAENAFQMAETGLRVNINTVDNDRTLLVASTGTPAVCTGTQAVAGTGTFASCTSYTDEVTPLLGASTGIGTGLAAYHFDATATGTSFNNAASVHTQSFYVPGPGAGN